MKHDEARHIPRCGGTLLAGTSVIKFTEPWLRGEIRTGFLNPSYILEGEGEYIDASSGRRYPYEPGMLLIRMPGVLHHQSHAPGRYVDKYFALPSPFYEILHTQGLLTPERPLLELGLHEWIASRFDRLADELAACGEEHLTVAMGNYFQFLNELLLGGSRNKPHFATIMAAAEYLEATAGETHPLPEVAARFQLSYPNFRRLFVEYLHVSPGEYRIRKRIEKIQSRLLDGDISLKETAAQFGYADVCVFFRQFRRVAGMTPGEFRRGRTGRN